MSRHTDEQVVISVSYRAHEFIPGIHQTRIVLSSREWEAASGKRKEVVKDLVLDLLASAIEVEEFEVVPKSSFHDSFIEDSFVEDADEYYEDDEDEDEDDYDED